MKTPRMNPKTNPFLGCLELNGLLATFPIEKSWSCNQIESEFRAFALSRRYTAEVLDRFFADAE